MQAVINTLKFFSLANSQRDDTTQQLIRLLIILYYKLQHVRYDI